MADSEQMMNQTEGTSIVNKEEELFDDVQMSRDGVHMLLNNKFDEASVLFQKYKDDSPLMHAGYSFVFFMQGLMSYEEELMDKALKALEETEKHCDVSNGFVKLMKKTFFKKKKYECQQLSVEDRIQRQVVVGDSLLYQAILVFTGQDIPSYIRGGWLLRKAWKIYEKLFKEVTELRGKQLKKLESKSSIVDGTNSISSTSNGAFDGNYNEIPAEVLERLQGAVNFGYGTFQICVSMIPPKILKLMEFLGFEGDRVTGLEALEYTCSSTDMKAPLATLGLLWYHTILRPFFALDGVNGYDTGCAEAELLIESKKNSFECSCLFQFFRGRIHRLRKETDLSLTMYSQAFKSASGQKELELMCLYEIGWCHILRLNWREGLLAFSRLKVETKWSKCYYTYLEAVCLGGMGDMKSAYEVFKEVPGLLKKKNNQIEAYVSRRAEKMKNNPPTQEYCRLLTLELVFLWHALPTLTVEELRLYLDVCDMQTDPNVFHLRSLLEGAIFHQLGEEEMALQRLNEAVSQHACRKDDLHVPPFAMFEMASVYTKKPETMVTAKSLLNEIKEKHKDYDFENRLVVRTNNALKKMKNPERA